MEDPAMKTINELVTEEQQAAKKIRIHFVEKERDRANKMIQTTVYLKRFMVSFNVRIERTHLLAANR